MFLVVLTYQKPVEEIEAYLADHVAFLDQQYAKKKLIFSGRRVPRTGGLFLVNSKSREEVDAIIQGDPFHQHQLADYDVIEFMPTKCDEQFLPFLQQ